MGGSFDLKSEIEIVGQNDAAFRDGKREHVTVLCARIGLKDVLYVVSSFTQSRHQIAVAVFVRENSHYSAASTMRSSANRAAA